MKLSQPKSARTINTSRILCELRKSNDLSKAELSRVLDLNKVSCGEIVDALVSDGIVVEGQKKEVDNGRKPTTLSLAPDSRFVLAIDVGKTNYTCALCSLDGKPVKIERMPIDDKLKDNEFCVQVLKSCARSVKLVDENKILGVGLTCADNKRNSELMELLERSIQKPVVVSTLSEALVLAENTVSDYLSTNEAVLYVNWSDTVEMSIVKNSVVVSISPNFGHLKVANNGLCSCGEIGCLEAFLSTGGNRLKDSWDSITDESLEMFAKALRIANRVTGSSVVVLGGEGATISDSKLCKIKNLCPKLKVERSELGSNAVILASSEVALDQLFYRTSLLNGMKDYI